MILKILRKILPASMKGYIKTSYFRIMSPYYCWQYIRHMKNLIAQADTKRPVQIALFTMIPQNWNSFESLYEAMCNDSRMNVTIYVFPTRSFSYRLGELNLNMYSEALDFFSKRGMEAVKGYDTVTGKYISPEVIKADYIFYNEPYDHYPDGYNIRNMYKRARICYSSYYSGIVTNEDMLRCVIPEHSFRFIYAYFAPGESHASYAERLYDEIGHDYHHVLRLGNPRFDLLKKLQELPIKVGGEERGQFTVLWNPRFIEGRENNVAPQNAITSTFFKFRTRINDRASSHEDEYYIVRPHPKAFSSYVHRGAMTPEEVEQYKSSLSENPRTELDTNKDYLDAFMRSDVMLADISGIVEEFLALGKPIIYCGDPDEIGLPEMLKCLYTASSWEEAESLIDSLKNGIDPLAQKRQDFARKLVSDGRSAQRIVNFLANDFMNAGH